VAYLCDLAKGKIVLDVGVVEHFAAATTSDQWLHGKIREVARQCVGVDVLADEIEALRARGYDVRHCDLTVEVLDETFDLIVMGEVIEHIGNPETFLANTAKMLKAGGRLVLTTPSPWYLNVLLKNLGGTLPFSDSADHVAWHEPSTLYELGRRT